MLRLEKLPLLLILSGIASVSMIVPATVALLAEEFHDARSFFYSGLVGLILTSLIAIAQAARPHNRDAMRLLLALTTGFVILPILLALPFYEAVRNTTFLNAYFEMVSSLTTTGLTLFDPERLSAAEHLWRAQVAWMGGLLIWVAAAAILAPLALGGFEVTVQGEPGQLVSTVAQGAQRERFDPAARVSRVYRALVPIYAGLTLCLWVMLVVAGDAPLVALVHAMSVMSSSGISAIGGTEAAPSGIWGEMIIFCFFFFALSRLTFSSDTIGQGGTNLTSDPEFRMGVIIVVALSLALYFRHWFGAIDIETGQDLGAGLRALWGSLFTVLSFLTTTGFVSADWGAAQGWSGLSSPGIILMGLAVVGGGVATTAGGVKLLRVYALYLNGMREIEKLVHPSSVGKTSRMGRRVRREGAFIAWVFFMLFAISLAGLTVIFAASSVPFEEALLMAVTALSNTGPLLDVAAEHEIDVLGMSDVVKLTLAAGMVLGRVELLAFITLFSPDLWRD